jgi:hypothetical protein
MAESQFFVTRVFPGFFLPSRFSQNFTQSWGIWLVRPQIWEEPSPLLRLKIQKDGMDSSQNTHIFSHVYSRWFMVSSLASKSFHTRRDTWVSLATTGSQLRWPRGAETWQQGPLNTLQRYKRPQRQLPLPSCWNCCASPIVPICHPGGGPVHDGPGAPRKNPIL